MPTVTASTPMPIMPLLPEFDSLSDDETGLSTRFYAALYATAHRFVTGVRAKRSYAEAYVSALAHYLQTFTSRSWTSRSRRGGPSPRSSGPVASAPVEPPARRSISSA